MRIQNIDKIRNILNKSNTRYTTQGKWIKIKENDFMNNIQELRWIIYHEAEMRFY